MDKFQELETPPDGYFTCSSCGCHFEPDPDTVLAGDIGTGEVPDGEEIPEGAISEADLIAMDADSLAKFGLTPETRDALIRGEDIVPPVITICTDCQHRMFEARKSAGCDWIGWAHLK